MADLKVNVITDGVDKAKGEISSLGGAGDAASGGIGNLAGAAAIGAGALIALGTKSILAFQDLGLTVGKFSAATGISATESSRLIEVAGDLGIGTDVLQKSVIKMTQGLGPAGDGLAKFGITAEKNADGTVNLSETLIKATGVINGIQDPLKKAEAQSAVFGKGFGKMAELTTMSADQLREKLAGVSDQKIFDDDKVNKAKDLRSGFDAIKDAGENLLLTIGNALAPVIASLATTLGKVLDKVAPLAESIGGLLASALELVAPILDGILAILGPIVEGLSKVNEAVTKVADSIHDALTENVEGSIAPGLVEAAQAASKAKESTEDLAEAQEAEAAAAKEAEAAHKALVKGLEDNLKAAQKLLNLNRAAADADFAVRDATDAYASELADLNKKIWDATAAGQSVDAVYRQLVTSATGLADRTVDLRVKQDEANGVTTTAAQKQDLWNQSMVNAAAQAAGPARQAIIDYISTANGIPAEKVTAISAALDAGDIAEANRLISDASRDRTAAIKADVAAASVWQATAALDQIAKDRIARFGVVITGNGGSSKVFASGTQDAPGGIALVGDDPREGGSGELVIAPKGGTIRSKQETAEILRDAAGGGQGIGYLDQSVNVHNYPPGVSPDTLIRAQRRTARRGLATS